MNNLAKKAVLILILTILLVPVLNSSSSSEPRKTELEQAPEPGINKFLESKLEDSPIDDRIEVIVQFRDFPTELDLEYIEKLRRENANLVRANPARKPNDKKEEK